MDKEYLQKQVSNLLVHKGIMFIGNPLTDFFTEDRYGHPMLFPPHNLKDEELWFGAGCLDQDNTTKVFAVADEEGILLGLVLQNDKMTEAWLRETGQWEQVEK